MDSTVISPDPIKERAGTLFHFKFLCRDYCASVAMNDDHQTLLLDIYFSVFRILGVVLLTFTARPSLSVYFNPRTWEEGQPLFTERPEFQSGNHHNTIKEGVWACQP